MAWLDDSGVTDLTADIKALADADYAAIDHYHDTLFAPASSENTKKIWVTTSGNLRLDSRASASDAYPSTADGYFAMGTQAPTNTAYKEANKVFATPNGSSGLPSMRALVANDLPAHGAATYIKTSSTTMPTSNTKVALNSINTTDSAVLAASSNGIKCLKAGKVLVSGGFYARQIGSGGAAVLIYQNSSSIGEYVQNAQGAGTASPVFPPRVVTVAANDVFYLYWRATSAGTCDANRAFLTVQYVV